MGHTNDILRNAGMPDEDKIKEMAAARAAEDAAGEDAGKGASTDTGGEQNKGTGNTFDWSKVEETAIFSHLTDKAGREIKGWDDLAERKVEIEKRVEIELPPELEGVRKFMNETGRGLNDFIGANKDWSQVSEDVVLREKLKVDNPHLDSEDIDFLFNKHYKLPTKLEGEEYGETELQENSDSIRLANINRKQKAAEGRTYFDEQKSKYHTPLEDKKEALRLQQEQGKEVWTDRSKSAIEGLQKIEQDGFEYSYKDKDKFGESASSLEGLIGRYRNEQGELDHGKLFKTLMDGEQLGSILASHKTHIESATKQELLREKMNPGKTGGEGPGGAGREGILGGEKSALQKSEDELLSHLD